MKIQLSLELISILGLFIHCIDGSHPFYLDHRPSGMSHGVYLRNSNGMDVILDQTYSSLTYKVIGGMC